MTHPRRPAVSSSILASLLLWTAAGRLPADTIFLKDGTQIPDCKVVRESEKSVSVRTPVGDMVVPRAQIARIQKVETVHDRYERERKAIADDDAVGLFKLAQWCRGPAGLRREGDDLLRKVFELDPGHAAARRLLGHVQVGKEWIVPEPLEIEFKTSGGTEEDRKALREQLGLFVRERRDVRLLPGGKTADAHAGCVISASVSMTQGASPTFYGKKLGGPQLGASVVLQARSHWIGASPVKTVVDGQVPSSVAGGLVLGIKNAVGGGSQTLHKYFDQILELRARALVKSQEQKRLPAKKKAHGSKA